MLLNMWGEKFLVLKLRLIHKLAKPHRPFFVPPPPPPRPVYPRKYAIFAPLETKCSCFRVLFVTEKSVGLALGSCELFLVLAGAY